MNECGIPVSVVHQGIDKNSVFGGKDNTLVNQRFFDNNQIHIPINDSFTLDDAMYIINNIKKGW
jgi:perosamine synthetase